MTVTTVAFFIGIYHIKEKKAEENRTLTIPDPVNSIFTVTVHIYEEVFSPETIIIQKNTKVIFQNNTNEPRWPASNIHPTHGIYPEFDPQRPIQPGESWSFVFTKVGKWRMHDHLSPRIVGSITVTE